MDKSLAFDFIGLYGALLKDIALYFPDDHVEWDRDFSRLTRLYQTRGQSVFTMDLPAIGKALDRSLADGRLALDGLNHTGSRFPGSKIPRLFWGLWSRLFDEGGLKADVDPNVVLFLRTLLYVGKNLEWECAPRYLYETTKEFFDIEAKVPEPSSIWDGDGDFPVGWTGHSICDVLDAPNGSSLFPDRDSDLMPVLASVQLIADRGISSLGFFNPDEWRFKHGPGSVSDLSAGSYKYSFPSWGRRLEYHFPADRYGFSVYGMLDRLGPDGIDVPLVEEASKLIAVPKTQKGPRLIASEPTSHQWVQQSIKDFLYTKVQGSAIGSSIHFNDQSYNQRAALLGSLTGDYATIDLKSASDRLSCWLVERLFRRNQSVLGPIIACRTKFIRNTIDNKQPSLHRLRKFTTQGSALTFPVQSLCFWTVAIGVGRHLNPGVPWRSLCERVRVFGDDIIVPVEWEVLVERVLVKLGLMVNRTKTFATGKFRESCGMDAWAGYDVTPPHITMQPNKSDPRSVASNVAVSNNFYKKGFWTTASWLRDQISLDSIPVVSHRAGAFGFTTFGKVLEPARKRWNDKLHHWETPILSITAKARKVKQDTAQALLQYFTEAPSPHMNYESGVAVAGVPKFRHMWVPVVTLGC